MFLFFINMLWFFKAFPTEAEEQGEPKSERRRNNTLWNNMSQRLLGSQICLFPQQDQETATLAWTRHQCKHHRNKILQRAFRDFWSLPNIFGSIFGACAAVLSVTAPWRSHLFMWHNVVSLEVVLNVYFQCYVQQMTWDNYVARGCNNSGTYGWWLTLQKTFYCYLL